MRILAVADEPSTGIGRVGSGVSDRRAHPAGEPSTGIGRVGVGAVRILAVADEPSTGIGRVGSLALGDRCGAVRILAVADEPSTGIGRVGSLAGEPSAGIGVVPCASLPWPMNPLQGSGVSDRSPANPLRGSVWCRAHPAVDR